MPKLRLVDNTGCITYVYPEDLTQFEDNLILDWDYNGGDKYDPHSISQSDWNQTLITKINQLSAYIHRNTLKGGANKLFMHSKLGPLIDTLEYIQTDGSGHQVIAGRYRIEFDDYLKLGEIIVTHEMESREFYGNRILLPEFTQIEGQMDEVVIKIYDMIENADYINQKLRKYTGVINILNYPDVEEYNRVSKEIIDTIESTLEEE